MNTLKTKRINGALYLLGKINLKEFISICETCKKRESCDEPNKKERITCTERKMESVEEDKMDIEEIIWRLKNIAKYAVHTPEEMPLVMSLDDGIALHEAAELLRTTKVAVGGNCILCGKQLDCGRLFVCKECELINSNNTLRTEG